MLDRIGHGQLVADRGQALGGEAPAQLEREQRVPQRGVDDPAQELTRQAQLEPLGQHPARRAEAERPHLQPLQRRQRALDGSCPAGTPGEHERHVAAVETPGREGERIAGGRVQPLEVVDGDQQRALGRERAKRVPESERDRAVVGRCFVRFRAQERHLQCVELGRRQPLQPPKVDPVEQVDQGGKGQLRLCPAGPGRHDPHRALARGAERSLPQRRLPDPGLAREHERTRSGPSAEVLVDRGKLLRSPDGPAR